MRRKKKKINKPREAKNKINKVLYRKKGDRFGTERKSMREKNFLL